MEKIGHCYELSKLMSLNLSVGVFKKLLPGQTLKKLLSFVSSESKAFKVETRIKMAIPPVRELSRVSYLALLGKHLSHKWMTSSVQVKAVKEDKAKPLVEMWNKRVWLPLEA